MYIKDLELINFRNYEKLNVKLNKNINIFVGDNAEGKTNILESIYYSSIGKSHRTNKDKELIKWDNKESYIKIYLSKDRIDKKIELKIFKEGKKGININSIKIHKVSELIGVLNVVMFSPEDLKIVKESPVYRRKFLDIEICKLNKRYYYNLVQYNKVLNERNAILKNYKKNNLDIIDIYDDQIGKFGEIIIKERYKYLKNLNIKGSYIHRQITSGNEDIKFEYITPIKNIEKTKDELIYNLKKNRQKDIKRKFTSLGPHRDDFSIYINNINTRKFASQGQQRTAVLTIKFASLEIIKDIIGEYPILLLDDVLSELDINRQKYILDSTKSIQTIITCTSLDGIKSYLKDKVKIYTVKNGKVK